MIATASILLTGTRIASADSPFSTQQVIIVADGTAVRQHALGPGSVRSLTEMAATLHTKQPITFMNTDAPTAPVGPIRLTDAGFTAIQDAIEATFKAEAPEKPGDLAQGLTAAFEMLGGENSANGSIVYVVAGANEGVDFATMSTTVSPLVAGFADKKWTITGISLPGASAESDAFLQSVSGKTGGKVYSAAGTTGFKDLANAILTGESRWPLGSVGERALKPEELYSTTVSIIPGTREKTLLIFKDNTYGSLRLTNPAGLEVSAGDRSASYVSETPNLVIWRLIDPAPGDWKIDARGMQGQLSIWEYSTNPYSVTFKQQAPMPLHKTNSIVAIVRENQQAVHLAGVRVFANVTTLDGAQISYEMNDDGVNGDAAAKDGNYSALIPPQAAVGTYKVRVEMSWPKYSYTVSSEGSFVTQVFPQIDLTMVATEQLEPGVRARVATALVHIAGSPYPISPEKLFVSLGSNSGAVEVEPRRLFGNGPASEFDVYFTPSGEALHSMVVRMSLDYAGRVYMESTPSRVLSSILPVAPAAPVVEAPAAAAPAPVVIVPPPAPAKRELPVGLIVAGVAILAVIAVASAYFLTRTRPYGYLYGESDVPLVDFANLKRQPVMAFLYRGLVKGSELGIPGLEGVVFRFNKDQIDLTVAREFSTVRVNNQPVVERTAIGNRTWIGARGRLYTFLTSRNPGENPSPAD
ncbi:MAG: hypothetical protein FJ319_13780 [SAR202 cluster bacterium]|nr:hypothetical protein [SAR202 cluster bacterium]